MVSMSSVPVGSSVFFSLTLFSISVFVLLLLRRFLTLRATPAYLILPVFLALALPASVVLLLPIDLASSSRDGRAAKGIWLPDRVVLVSWRIAYWLIFVLTWYVYLSALTQITSYAHRYPLVPHRVILPLLGEYIDSGYREPKARLMYSLRSNARYQLTVLCCATVGLVYVSIQNGFEFTSIKALVMALAYVWGLVLAIYLMGHGLVSIPRRFIRSANVSGSLRRLQSHAPRIHDRLLDAVNDLENLEAQVAQLQQRKSGSALEFREWIEELAEPSSSPESRPMLAQAPDVSSRVPPVITARYLADLTRRLQRARHQKARFVDEWARLIRSATDLQAIINSSASKKLQFSPLSSGSSSFPRVTLLTPYTRYLVYVKVLPTVRLFLGTAFAVASVLVIWSELIKSFAQKLSVVSLTVVPNLQNPGPIGFGGQVTASAWLLYMCAAALAGIHDAQIWGNRALVHRNTYGESACWYAGQVARLTVPIAYNFLTFLPKATIQSTTFYHFLGRLIDLTPLGKGFDYFFPVLILLPVFATLFNFYGKVKTIFGFDLPEGGEDDMNDPSGYGLGGWREGRDLIDQEFNGLGPLAFASGAGRSARLQSGRVEGESHASSTSTLPLSSPEGVRPTRSARGAAVYSTTALDEDEEEETFLQSFVHRVKNTFETTNKPQWLQGEGFRLPKWMSSDSNEQSGGLTGFFGGRQPADGRVRLG